MSTQRCYVCWYVSSINGITDVREYNDQVSNPLRLIRMRCLMLAVEEWSRAIL